MSEIDLLRGRLRRREREYDDCRERISDCRKKLERLKPAKKRISELKSDFRTIQTREKNYLNRSRDWTGQTEREFRRLAQDVVDENKSYLSNSLDYALDAINDEITRLQNKIMEENGLLGKLGALINSLRNEIEKLLN